MSREEQIKWLRRLLKSREDPRGDTEIDVALKCAIEALEKEPCEDCIRRSDIGLTDFEIIMCNGDYREGLKILLEKIAAAPSVTPQPKMGHWIDIMVGDMPAQACDQCNTFYPLAYTGGGHKYCPNCGAKMSEIQTGSEGREKND